MQVIFELATKITDAQKRVFWLILNKAMDRAFASAKRAFGIALSGMDVARHQVRDQSRHQ